jgi:hypothetical protein
MADPCTAHSFQHYRDTTEATRLKTCLHRGEECKGNRPDPTMVAMPISLSCGMNCSLLEFSLRTRMWTRYLYRQGVVARFDERDGAILLCGLGRIAVDG